MPTRERVQISDLRGNLLRSDCHTAACIVIRRDIAVGKRIGDDRGVNTETDQMLACTHTHERGAQRDGPVHGVRDGRVIERHVRSERAGIPNRAGGVAPTDEAIRNAVLDVIALHGDGSDAILGKRLPVSDGARGRCALRAVGITQVREGHVHRLRGGSIDRIVFRIARNDHAARIRRDGRLGSILVSGPTEELVGCRGATLLEHRIRIGQAHRIAREQILVFSRNAVFGIEGHRVRAIPGNGAVCLLDRGKLAMGIGKPRRVERSACGGDGECAARDVRARSTADGQRGALRQAERGTKGHRTRLDAFRQRGIDRDFGSARHGERGSLRRRHTRRNRCTLDQLMRIGGRRVEPVLLRVARRVFDLEVVGQVDLLIKGAFVRFGRSLRAHAGAVDSPGTLSSCGNAVRIALLRRRVDGTRNSHIHRRCARSADTDGLRRDAVIGLDKDDGRDDILLQFFADFHLVGHRPYKRTVVKRHALDVVDPRTETVLAARRAVVKRGLRTELGENLLIQGAVLSGLDAAQRLVAFFEVRADGAVANLARLDERAGIGRGYRSGGGDIDASGAIGGGVEGNGARGTRSARDR